MVAGRVAATSVIGVDVGGTKILAGVVDRDGSVLESREGRTPSSQAELLRALEGAVRDLLADGAAAVGFGLASRIDQSSGTALASTNIPLTGVPFRDWMSGRLGLPVTIDNDANAAAFAEWAVGVGRGTQDLVMLTLGTGIGGGVIVGGRPFRGSTGAGVELGHIVIDEGGPACQGTCTGRGHLEAVASGGAADRVARELFGPGADARDLLARARSGDERALAAVVQMGRFVGAAVASLVNIFEPELVVLGGGFAAGAADLLLPPVREVVARDGLEPGRDRVRIEPAQLGVQAGVVGAGLLAVEAVEGRL
jgi:glucokinase